MMGKGNVMARQLRRTGIVSLTAAVGVLFATAACGGSSDDAPRATSTCDLLPRDEVAAALSLPGQGADDLEMTGTEFDPTSAGAGADANECTAGDPAVATIRAVSIKATSAENASESDEVIVGSPCRDFEPLPDSVDAVGGTCLTVSTEVRGRWDDDRVTVQLYRAAGEQPTDRDTVIDIAQRFHDAAKAKAVSP
jgi:hypothetical protein